MSLTMDPNNQDIPPQEPCTGSGESLKPGPAKKETEHLTGHLTDGRWWVSGGQDHTLTGDCLNMHNLDLLFKCHPHFRAQR